ncbi:AAA family ATPase [Flavobacterium sp. ZT3R25]|uniref:AAA family ATPase n=1 Tax=Flavobacterium galactosi TaxID=3398735 RepID=UPI003A898C76
MSNIDKVRIHNFKAFYTGAEPEEIKLNGKHLLMYGENGSGKSSIYWALYTLFQSETKRADEIAKYFTPTHDEQLLNFNYLNQRPDFEIDAEGKITNPTDIGKNAEIEVLLEDSTSLKIDKDGNYESVPNKIKELNRHSDFITHRLLVNFYNFRNSEKIDLWEVFVRDFLPFLRINKGNGDITLWENFSELQKDLVTNDEKLRRTSKHPNHKAEQERIKKEIEKFNEDLEYWIGRINTIANEVYRNELKIKDNIAFFLKYENPLRFEDSSLNIIDKNGVKSVSPSNHASLNVPNLVLNIRRQNNDGTYSLIHRPQSYLNEAKITQIALSLRFSLLHETIKPTYPGQFLALDDLLISLDMSNRDIVLNAILNIYAKRFKIYFFTHEKSYYDFCVFKIEQKKEKKDWEIMEIHSGETKIEKPVIIQSGLNYYDKAIKYFKAKDYTTSSLYLRKELEKLVIERLPEEYTKTIDGQFHNLEHYWKLFVERYKMLGKNISEEIKDYFKQSKLLILNPAAHHNLNLPVYKLELERVFKLVEKIYDEYPIPQLTIFMARGMSLIFKHPSIDYSFKFELLSDFRNVGALGTSILELPKCKILHWQFQGVDFCIPASGRILSENEIEKNQNRKDDRIDDILRNLKRDTLLNITNEMFVENLFIENSIWSFNEVIEKANIKDKILAL